MDTIAHHFTTEEAVPDNKEVRKFLKGVVVFKALNPGNGEAPGKQLSLGEIFVTESEVPSCHNCKKPGHKRADCPEKKQRLCRNCDKPGHVKSDCPDKYCSNCEAKDHYSHQCPLCRTCNKAGHKARSCPDRPSKKRNGCLNCSSLDHGVSECTEPCKNCKSSEHKVEDCFEGLHVKSEAEPVGKTDVAGPVEKSDVPMLDAATGTQEAID